MATFRSYPRRLKPSRGEGYVQCARSGFLRHPKDMVNDFRGGLVARDYADITPGFGTRHPRDVFSPDVGGDPTPTSVTGGAMQAFTKDELFISDAEIEASIRENRHPRPDRKPNNQMPLCIDDAGLVLTDPADGVPWNIIIGGYYPDGQLSISVSESGMVYTDATSGAVLIFI